MAFEYLAILIFLFVVAAGSQYYFKIRIFKSIKHFIVFYVFLMILGTIWDNFAVARGHWYYPGRGISGIFIGLIPIEDYFFGFVCAYFILVWYKILELKLKF